MFWFLLLTLTRIGFSEAQSCPDCSYSSPGSAHFFLSDLTYSDSVIYTTPSHLAVAYGTVAFDFYNNATAGTLTCRAASNQAWEFFYGDVVYQCTVPVQQGNATFTFNQTIGEVGIDETWWCAGYLGAAIGKVDLDCEHNYWVNPDWTWPSNGSLYSIRNTTCKPTKVDVAPYITYLGS